MYISKNRKMKNVLGVTITQVLLIFLSMLYLFPFLWMLATALKTPEEFFSSTMSLLPKNPQWGNFYKSMQAIPFVKYTGNTLFITISVMIGVLLSSSLVAYSFARLRWPGRNIAFIVMMSTMMLPSQIILIPSFVLFKTLGWYNSFKPLIIPAFFGGGAFNIFLLRQFYRTIPMEMSESAKIDGCSEIKIWWKIVLPLCKPILSAIAVFTFLGGWNDFFGPLIYINDPDKVPLALGLRAFQQQHTAQWDLMMAASIITTMPTLILYFSFQKYFVEGITLSGIKG